MSFSRSRAGLALAGAVLTLGATTALAEDEFVPVLTGGQVFLQCAEPNTKVDIATATWGAAAPASVTTGAGCGKPDEPVFSGTIQETPYTFALGGNVKGNIDELTVTLHSFDAGASRVPGTPHTLAVRAVVGGKSLFGFTERESVSGELVASPEERLVEITPVGAGSTGQVTSLSFTITDIDFLTELDLNRKSGHQVLIDVRDATENPVVTSSNAHAWVWGAAEAPSGVVFTPEAPAAAVLVADARDTRK